MTLVTYWTSEGPQQGHAVIPLQATPYVPEAGGPVPTELDEISKRLLRRKLEEPDEEN